MSILSEILSTGHVDKELLDALDDEQKQLLFCQMRAEQMLEQEDQVRKWEAFEDRMNRQGPPKRNNCKKNVRWLTGVDGEVWVWVMGDHPTDPSIDQILDEEARKEAHLRALREIQFPEVNGVANTNNSPNDSQSQSLNNEEALKAQLGSMEVGVSDTYDDADLMFDPSHPTLFQPPRPTQTNVATFQQPEAISATVSSYSIPQPQRAELRGTSTFSKPQPQVTQPLPFPVLQAKPWEDSNGVRLRQQKTQDVKDKVEEMQKRESEIFQSIQEHRERLRREAEQEAERRRQEWEIENKRAREAENAMRQMAQKAREKHRQLIRTSTSILPALKDTKATSLREALKNLPRPPKPKSRQAIIDWFKRDELARGTGLDPKTRAPAVWFHGIISRDQSEILLSEKPRGSYLVRVSERIWGYTVSYVVGDGSYKHFLVERIAEGYQFLGTNQVVHEQLFDLVSYHESAPITAKGGEILLRAVGQVKGATPDYSDLLDQPSYRPPLVSRF